MATRFYLPSSGTPPLAALAKNAAWELETGLVRLPCFTAKQNTALTTSTRTWAAATTQQWCWYQFQSEPLPSVLSWTTTHTVSIVLGKLAETTANGDTTLCYNIRVVSSDGSVIRGIIGAVQAASGTEFALVASAATRIFNAVTTGATSFSSQVGDRIIIEIGVHGVTPALEALQFRIGDPAATANFALTTALTTDLCSWVLLSQTIPTCAIHVVLAPVSVQSAVLSSAASKTESGSAFSSQSAVRVTASANIESSVAISAQSASCICLVAINEHNTLVETATALVPPSFSLVSEYAPASDSCTSLCITQVSVSETNSASANSYSTSISSISLTEYAALNDLIHITMVATILYNEKIGSSSSVKYWSGSAWKSLSEPIIL